MNIIAAFCVFFGLTVGVLQSHEIGRIVGGNDADISNYPYQLQLEYYDFICGAVLVSYTFALTAGHCVYEKSLEVFVVRAGTTTLGEGGQEFSVIEVIYHPTFDNGINDYDAALLHLSDTVTTPDAQPIQLAADDSSIYVGAPITISGWGWNRSVNDDYDDGFMQILQVAELSVVDDQECRSLYGDSYFTESMFCVGDTEGYGRGIWLGDAGGPAAANGVLAGIISFGGGPNVFVKISKVQEWIQSIISD